MARVLTSAPDVPDGPAEPSTTLTRSSLYRAVWRWHFYAGLLVLPLLIWLAVTGALYVYHDAIDQRVHADLLTVPVPASPSAEPAPHSAVLAAALGAQPGVWFKYTPAAAPGRSAEVGVRAVDGAKVAVYLNPANAQVLGTLSDRGTLGWTIRKLHSLKYFGPVQRGFIEMAAGWAVLLVLTGFYLWWPRGQGKARLDGVVSVRGTPRQRVYWRDLHAVTGLVVGVGLLFLAITGMPWSVLWGAKANQWANGHNYGYPAGVRVQLPMSGQPLAVAADLPWTLQQTQQPGGAGHDGHAGHQDHAQAKTEDNPHALYGEGAAAQPAPASSDTARTALSIDAVMDQVQRLQLAPGYTVNPPQGAQGVFTASVFPHDLARQRVVHLAQFTGQPLLDMSYVDYGPLGRWLEWGINIHLGQEWGVLNQLLLLALCAGVVLLCVSGAVMWFKRRPAGSVGVPPLPAQRRALVGVFALLAIGGIAFPLVGLSMAAIGVFDAIVVLSKQR